MIIIRFVTQLLILVMSLDLKLLVAVLSDLRCLHCVSHLLHHLQHLPHLDLHCVPHVAGTAPIAIRPDHHDLHRLPLLVLPHHVHQFVWRIRTHDT